MSRWLVEELTTRRRTIDADALKRKFPDEWAEHDPNEKAFIEDAIANGALDDDGWDIEFYTETITEVT